MIMSRNVHPAALCLFALTLLTPFGCKSAGGEGTGGSSVSAPVQINTSFKTRDPRQCTGFTAQPSPAQAALLVQCTMDTKSNQYINLIQNVKVQMASSRAFLMSSDSYLTEVDTASKVIPIRGSLTAYGCSTANPVTPAGKNCQSYDIPSGSGMCWKTTFGDWKCSLGGANANIRYQVAGPTAF
jgi:hypothetical protein